MNIYISIVSYIYNLHIITAIEYLIIEFLLPVKYII